MTKFDLSYHKLCDEILKNGVRCSNRTGIDTIKLPFYHFEFDLQDQFPILTTKFVAFKHSVIELLWIYQEQTSNVNWLNDRGVTIWDEWKIDDNGYYNNKFYGKEYSNTIGTAYGYVVNKYKLTDFLISELQKNGLNRRIIINLFQNEYIGGGTLEPCVFCTEWDVTNGYLNLLVHQRSCDVGLGLPFNVSQYACFLALIAQCTNLKPGKILYTIKDAHIYVNHIDAINKQLDNLKKSEKLPVPKLIINPEITNFYQFDNSKELKDIKLDNYEHCGKIKMNVAV